MEMKLAQYPLPMTAVEMATQGYDQLDFLIITGDAYVDHPSFGAALIGRVLQGAGYRVGVLAQPDWRDTSGWKEMGRPKLGVLISAGNMDSMVSNYTAAGKPRRDDDFSVDNKGGQRPDRASIVYANTARSVFGKIPIVLGGIEASLRRLAHYDYWSDKVRRSVLLDSRADLVLYGMAEFPLLEVAELLKSGQRDFSRVKGACYLAPDCPSNAVALPNYEEVSTSHESYAQAFRLAYLENNPFSGRKLCQKHGDSYVVVNPPPSPLTTEQLDWVYGLPFTRSAHPRYENGIKALEEVRFSITSHRGCFGACSFCALTAHQGRIVQRRSMDSVLGEAKLLTTLPDFKGFIHDVGGPTANFNVPACSKQSQSGACKGKECLHPSPCKKLHADHNEYLALLRAIRQIPGVKKVFVRSGLRYDFAMLDSDDTFLEELCEHHVSGQLKIAPEHVSPRVLKLMGKPSRSVYEAFVSRYQEINRRVGKDQFIVPYFMSSHPGSRIEDAIALAEYFRDNNLRPRQVQDFIPTPGSLSTCMYHTGTNPLTGEKVDVPRSQKEKLAQRTLLQYYLPRNQDAVREILTRAGREDLIGYGPKALVRPAPRRTVKQDRSPGKNLRPGQARRGKNDKKKS